MLSMKSLGAAVAALAISVLPVLAQAPLNFADVDTDASGELSFAELQAVWPDLTQDAFNAADLDMTGGLSAEELAGLQPAALSAPAPLDGGAMMAPEPAPDAGTPSSLVETPD